jgi:hypothetical protein
MQELNCSNTHIRRYTFTSQPNFQNPSISERFNSISHKKPEEIIKRISSLQKKKPHEGERQIKRFDLSSQIYSHRCELNLNSSRTSAPTAS